MSSILTRTGAILGIIVSASGVAGAAVLYNPFVSKTQYESDIKLIGGDAALSLQLRKDGLEQDLFIVQDLAERERAKAGRMTEGTRRRLLNIQSQINTLDAKIKLYDKRLNN